MSLCFLHSVSRCCPEQLTPCPLVMRPVAYGVWRLVWEKSSVKSSRHNCQPMDSLIMLDFTREEEQLPSSQGARHLWKRASSLRGDRIRKCFMSETRLTGAHCRRLMSPAFKVWRKWNFDRMDGKPFTCRVESAFAGLTAACRDAERGCAKRVTLKNSFINNNELRQ